jgi:hypothetical protein
MPKNNPELFPSLILNGPDAACMLNAARSELQAPRASTHGSSFGPPRARNSIRHQAHIEAIAKNQERIANFGSDSALFRARAVVLERAVPSIADARTTLGMSAQEIGGMIAAADIAPAW